MRKWLRDPVPEIPEIPEIPQQAGSLQADPAQAISGICGISGKGVRLEDDLLPEGSAPASTGAATPLGIDRLPAPTSPARDTSHHRHSRRRRTCTASVEHQRLHRPATATGGRLVDRGLAGPLRREGSDRRVRSRDVPAGGRGARRRALHQRVVVPTPDVLGCRGRMPRLWRSRSAKRRSVARRARRRGRSGCIVGARRHGALPG